MRQTQIVATIGPASEKPEILKEIIKYADLIRFNFSWAPIDERTVEQFALIRKLANEAGRRVFILQDIPGPRIQDGAGHTNDESAESSITPHDEKLIEFGVKNDVDYIALSFVGSVKDVNTARQIISSHGGKQKVIAKIERQMALDNLDEIISASDAIMIARGDLGEAIALERVPFVQIEIIEKCEAAGKPVITATQMLLSMVDNDKPTRAEVSDVAHAILQGTDAVMLSEETAKGKNPLEAVKIMDRIAYEAERHRSPALIYNHF